MRSFLSEHDYCFSVLRITCRIVSAWTQLKTRPLSGLFWGLCAPVPAALKPWQPLGDFLNSSVHSHRASAASGKRFFLMKSLLISCQDDLMLLYVMQLASMFWTSNLTSVLSGWSSCVLNPGNISAWKDNNRRQCYQQKLYWKVWRFQSNWVAMQCVASSFQRTHHH